MYLTGFVEIAAEKRGEATASLGVAGVQGLRDYLHVRPPLIPRRRTTVNAISFLHSVQVLSMFAA